MSSTLDAGVIRALEGLQATRFSTAAAVAIYLYNILITLDLEVEHVWSSFSFSLHTLLYLFNRYISLGFFLLFTYNYAEYHGSFSVEYCKAPLNFISFVLSYMGWTGILTMRVCCLWEQRRRLVWAIQTAWVVMMCAYIVTEYFAYKEGGATMSYNLVARICAPTSQPHIFKLTPITPIIYELFLTVLTVIKAFDLAGHPFSMTLPSLYRVLVRDGVVYFALSTVITAVNMIVWYCLPDNQLYIICPIYWAVMSSQLAQMVLNLKDANKRIVWEHAEISGVDGNFTFEAPNQSTFMEDTITESKSLGKHPTSKPSEVKLTFIGPLEIADMRRR